MTFTELLKLHGHTDKVTYHDYGRWYDQIFPYKRLCKRVLLLGVSLFGGGDALAFADYFGFAEITAVDITHKGLLPAVLDHPRIRFVEADAYASATVPRLGGNFDLIVDDALHDKAHQHLAARLHGPTLAKDGLYIVEDTLPGRWKTNPAGWRRTIIDMTRPACDNDCLVLLWRAEEPGPFVAG